jgi:outer membrane immunogenic protein
MHTRVGEFASWLTKRPSELILRPKCGEGTGMTHGGAFRIGLVLASTALSTTAFAGDWSGPYIGLKGGGAALKSDFQDDGSSVFDDATLKGMLFGVEGGFNTELDNNLVLGLVGDLLLSTVDGDGLFNPGDPFTLDLKSLGSLQGKIGVALGPDKNTLVFLNGGVAIGSVKLSGYPDTSKKTHVGFIFGAGVEHQMSETVSLVSTVSYVNLGKETYNPGEVVKLSGITGTIGINLHF